MSKVFDVTFFGESNRAGERRHGAGARLRLPPEEVLYCNRHGFPPVPLRVVGQAQHGTARLWGSAPQRPLLSAGFGLREAVADAGAGGGDAAERGLV